MKDVLGQRERNKKTRGSYLLLRTNVGKTTLNGPRDRVCGVGGTQTRRRDGDHPGTRGSDLGVVVGGRTHCRQWTPEGASTPPSDGTLPSPRGLGHPRN